MYLGIEIGGTKLQLGLGEGDGTLAALWRGTVNPAQGAAGIREQIVAAVPELLSKANTQKRDVRGVGVGFGGPVDDATNTVIKSHQIEGWDNFPLADWIRDLLGWEVALGNDADVAGLGEALFGAGKGLSPIFYITVGTGIGGGLIINGEIYRGCGRGAAEIGHLKMAGYRGDIDATGFHDNVLESFASGWAIAREANGLVKHGLAKRSRLATMAKKTGFPLTSKQVAQAAREKDRTAIAIIDHALSALAGGICQAIALLGPRRIVIGGGVSLLGQKRFFRPLRALVKKRAFEPLRDCFDIVPAALGEEVVVHGSLALARKRFHFSEGKTAE